ncbi:MAG: asparagine synthase (glutamine-hydrolyzing) [Gemmataceae bacterium]|nr:asparagine synthase (glutamine-hydrolyzing) [Gemmataceae bacterium]
MTALAGIVSLDGRETPPAGALARMTQALAHRGPGGGIHEEPGIGLAWRHRRVASSPEIVAANEDNHIIAACAGFLVNHAELRNALLGRGHQLRSDNPAESLTHLWEESRELSWETLRGQFACAVWDRRLRLAMLARDRFGMAPLYWSRHDSWLLFASEIKALFASGLVRAEVDRRGVDHIFTFMGLPAARTCFQNVQALPPGHYLVARAGTVQVARYWDLDFPDRGQEEAPGPEHHAADRLEELLQQAVARRLPADDSAASYISGGIDCSTLAALAGKVRQRPLPTYTVRIADVRLDESERALRVGQACGIAPIVESFDAARVIASFPRLIRAIESPTPDASCVTLMLLAERVRADGRPIVLTGDGADDLFAGYPWFKTDRLLRMLDVIPGLPFGQALRRLVVRLTAPHIRAGQILRTQRLIGGHNAWLDLYGLISMNRSRFYSQGMRDSLAGHLAYEDLSLNLERLGRWHPLNRALYFGLKTHVPGLLLQGKGERIGMHSGVELRFPYLDEDVVEFSTRLPPSWKLRRWRDKFLLRRVAERYLPADIAWRPKRDFTAALDSLYRQPTVRWVEELLSEESLRRAGYFDPAAVQLWRQQYGKLPRIGSRRFSVELGLSAVVATQLWHHLHIDAGLADVPT